MPNKKDRGFINPHESPFHKETREVHKCPLGVVINPWWMRVAAGTVSMIGIVAWFAVQSAYNSYASVAAAVQAHQIVIDQIKAADLPNRVVRIEAVQGIQTQTQDRLETKMDRMLEVQRIPNPAPKPEVTTTNN